MRHIFALILLLALPGCVASVVKDVVTAPIRVASKTVDILTTSQSEADQKRGKRLREHEARLGELARKREKAARNCNRGKTGACEQLAALDEEIAEERAREI